MIRFILSLLAALFLSGYLWSAIDINTATKQELETLKGIGPIKAQAIIEHRSKHGPFRNINEITQVQGVGEITFGNIKNQITTGSSSIFDILQKQKLPEEHAKKESPQKKQPSLPLTRKTKDLSTEYPVIPELKRKKTDDYSRTLPKQESNETDHKKKYRLKSNIPSEANDSEFQPTNSLKRIKKKEKHPEAKNIGDQPKEKNASGM
jgi:competence protein ComEA